MNKGVGFACITVPLMWIAVVNQNLKPLGMSQVWIRVYIQYILTTCVLELKDNNIIIISYISLLDLRIGKKISHKNINHNYFIFS